jgi:hypothetical protein
MVPRLAEPDVVVWPLRPTPHLLCDGLFCETRGADPEWGVAEFRRLGALAAHLCWSLR